VSILDENVYEVLANVKAWSTWAQNRTLSCL